MELVNRFADLEYREYLPVSQLEIDRPYELIRVATKHTKYGSTILATLMDSEGKTLHVFMSKRYAYAIKCKDYEDINKGDVKYRLIYKGINDVNKSYTLAMELCENKSCVEEMCSVLYFSENEVIRYY
jgi:hypothetical protein